MELRALRYFLAVAREESITRAAERLHLTQPNLSRQLRELEEELGTTLFIRGRGITLTEEGQIFRKRVEETMELLDKARTEVAASAQDIGGDIYIGCAETDVMRIVFHIIKKIRDQYPGIHIHLTSGHEEVVAERLERGLLDFGVFMEPTDMQKYEFVRLPETDTWGLLIRKDDPLAMNPSIRPRDLVGLPLICSNQELFQNQLAGWSGKIQDKMEIIATYNLLFNASLMVEEGLGYAICLDKIIPTTADRPLCFRPLEPRMEAGISVAWKKYQVFSKAAQIFLNHLQSNLTGSN
ncbi:MAG: LysR family transcriptional regulator [Lawsonibacter sp.]|nr:LysR family transcriptional regulator [Lawsonibacter sp.]